MEPSSSSPPKVHDPSTFVSFGPAYSTRSKTLHNAPLPASDQAGLEPKLEEETPLSPLETQGSVHSEAEDSLRNFLQGSPSPVQSDDGINDTDLINTQGLNQISPSSLSSHGEQIDRLSTPSVGQTNFRTVEEVTAYLGPAQVVQPFSLPHFSLLFLSILGCHMV